MNSSENERLHDAQERLLALVAASEAGRVDADADGRANEDLARLPELEGAFGPYELERSLGHGGQGVVYLANDTRLGRKVALKLLSASASAGATARARFEREATAASRLSHANICTVYEAGELEGQRFLAMEFVDGEGLTEWIARTSRAVPSTGSGSSSTKVATRDRIDEVLCLVEQIARAVQAAHEAGVVHRDLKPQNIMLRGDGSPVVLDFGLARDDSEDGAALTMQGDVLGTPAYMPPERVRGAGGRAADPREDVYGLGAILYECLTGERPFRGQTREQLYQRILTSQVGDPRDLDAAIPREAKWVVETAMEKSPDRRYASAKEFADELHRLQKREPIQARPVPAWLRLQRWVQRHPGAAIPTIAAFLVLIAGVVLSLLLAGQVDAEARLTNIRALLSESALQSSRDPQAALLLAREATRQLPADAPHELRTAVRSQLVEALSSTRLLRHFSHEDTRTVGVGFSGDGQRVATVVRGKHTPALRLWPIDGRGEPLFKSAPIVEESSGNTAQLTGCAFDEAGARLLVTPYSGVPRVLSLTDASLLHVLMPRDKPRKGKPAPIQFNHNGVRQLPGTLACFVPGADDLALVGAQDGARLWRLTPGTVAAEEVWHDRRANWRRGVSQIAVSADGALCATGDRDGAVRLLRVDPFEVVGQSPKVDQHQQAVHALAFDPSRPLLLTSGWDQPVSIWSTESVDGESQLRRVGTLDINGLTANWLQFAPPVPGRADVLVVLDTDRGAQLYRSVNDSRHFEHYASVSGNNSEVPTVAFSPDGSKFVIGTHGGDVRVFGLRGHLLDVLHGSASMVLGSCWSPDGHSLVTTESSGSANLWQLTDPSLRVHRVPRALFRMVLAGGQLAAAMRDGGLMVMDLADESFVTMREPDRRIATSLALRADGLRMAALDGRSRFDLWDLSGNQPHLEPANPKVWRGTSEDAFAYAPDGSLFVSEQKSVQVLRVDGTWEQVAEFDGRGVAVATARGVVVVGNLQALWGCEPPELDDARVLWPASEEEAGPSRADTSADGRWLALVGSPRDAMVRVRVVDVVERRLHCEMELAGARGAALSADGSQLVTTNVT